MLLWNVSEYEHRVAAQYRSLRQWTLCVVVVVTLVGWYAAWTLLCLKRHRARRLFENLLVADALVLFSPMLAQFVYEVHDNLTICGVDACEVSKLMQTYSLSLSAYLLVTLAFFPPDYWLVAPSHFMALYTTGFLYLLRWGDRCAIYASLARHSPCYDAFLLVFMYAVPCFFLAWALADAMLAPRKLPRALLDTLQMAAVMSLWHLLTNLPFVVVLVLNRAAEGTVPYNMATLFEILSVVNHTFQPYVFVVYQYEKGCFRDVLGKLVGREDPPPDDDPGAAENVIHEDRSACY